MPLSLSTLNPLILLASHPSFSLSGWFFGDTNSGFLSDVVDGKSGKSYNRVRQPIIAFGAMLNFNGTLREMMGEKRKKKKENER